MFEHDRTNLFSSNMRCICIFLVSPRDISKALEPFVDRSYVAIWYIDIEEFDPIHDVYLNKKKGRRLRL